MCLTGDLAGGCECGRVRFVLTDRPITVNACHCRDCQRITGSAFALNAMIEDDRIVWTSDHPPIERERDGGRMWRCAHCDALLAATHPMMKPHIRFLRVGTLDEGERLPPDAHYFVRSRHHWIALPPDVPAFETLPGEGEGVTLPPEAERRMADALL